jgi:hypothetical protein
MTEQRYLLTVENDVAPPRGERLTTRLLKSSEEQRYVLGVAYQAGPDPKIQRGLDGGRDFISPAELEKSAWAFMTKSGKVGLHHLDGTDGAATIVESYIWRGNDWDIGGTIVKAGDWLIGAVLDEHSWNLFKAGRVTGWSPQGKAKRRKPSATS